MYYSNKTKEELIKILEEKDAIIENLINQANTDEMTGLKNYRFLMSVLPQIISSCHRNKEKICLCILDIDDFKNINDNFGHLMGDRVLKKIADTLKKNIREGDILSRYSSRADEFVLVFPNTNIEEAKSICQRLQEEIKNYSPVLVSVSIGMSFVDLGKIKRKINAEKIAEKLIDKADIALIKNGKKYRKGIISLY